MKVEYSGWSEKHGSFHCSIYVDETKTDYEIHYESGKLLRQCGPFERVTADWNCDGDVYTQFGANFERYDADGKARSGREFWTPEDLVAELVDGVYGDGFGKNDKVVSISGVKVPSIEKRKSLSEQIALSEGRQMMRDVDRNNKMNALSVGEHGELWVK